MQVCELRLMPRVTLWLFQVAAQRGAYGEERYEKMEFQRKVGQQFAILRDVSWKVRRGPEGMGWGAGGLG